MQLDIKQHGKSPNEHYRVRLITPQSNQAKFIGYIVRTDAVEEAWAGILRVEKGNPPSVLPADSYEQAEKKVKSFVRKHYRDQRI